MKKPLVRGASVSAHGALQKHRYEVRQTSPLFVRPLHELLVQGPRKRDGCSRGPSPQHLHAGRGRALALRIERAHQLIASELVKRAAIASSASSPPRVRGLWQSLAISTPLRFHRGRCSPLLGTHHARSGRRRSVLCLVREQRHCKKHGLQAPFCFWPGA